MSAQTLNPITLAIAAVAAASVVGCNELDRSFSYSTAPTQEDQDRRYCEIEARAMIPDASPPVRRVGELDVAVIEEDDPCADVLVRQKWEEGPVIHREQNGLVNQKARAAHDEELYDSSVGC